MASPTLWQVELQRITGGEDSARPVRHAARRNVDAVQWKHLRCGLWQPEGGVGPGPGRGGLPEGLY